jgi:hypothetical protein
MTVCTISDIHKLKRAVKYRRVIVAPIDQLFAIDAEARCQGM